MRYSISQLATMSGISARTLRHYDAIGLLAPAEIGANGYRWYGRGQLLRLQRILLLREVGVPLGQIGQVLDGQVNEITALRAQREQILAEQHRLSTVIETIDATITDLTGAHTMEPADFFHGLHHDRSRLKHRLEAAHGPAVEDAFAAVDTATDGWTITDYEQAAAESRALLHRMARLMRHQVPPDDQEAQQLVGEHHGAISQFWEADAEAYRALADLYLNDDEQRAWITDINPALPGWLATAMKYYATHHLHVTTFT
ncbi:MerR family transcriptional regulator [Kocuria rosea]|uniref:MerR family transcriptional regulator n=1 Tax=Kocuria rosea TaxID=1275 RepID=UPI000D64989C|nr:MerR family transcriptional regulator [Kocuria rosea]PWF79389.1 MerR family transcriptional regulator [Kocuria rosea]